MRSQSHHEYEGEEGALDSESDGGARKIYFLHPNPYT